MRHFNNVIKGGKGVDHANFIILVVLFLTLLTIRLSRRKSRRPKPELPDLLRSRLLKAKIVTRSM
jgi:hypothetical protein